MPLSEQERRVLEELEAQLSADDPKFASAMVVDPMRSRRRRRVGIGVLGVIAGVAIIVAGVITKVTILNAVGLVLVIIGAAHAVTQPPAQLRAVPRPTGPAAGSTPFGTSFARPRRGGFKPARPRRESGAFMARMEERWERRRRENQGW